MARFHIYVESTDHDGETFVSSAGQISADTAQGAVDDYRKTNAVFGHRMPKVFAVYELKLLPSTDWK